MTQANQMTLTDYVQRAIKRLAVEGIQVSSSYTVASVGSKGSEDYQPSIDRLKKVFSSVRVDETHYKLIPASGWKFIQLGIIGPVELQSDENHIYYAAVDSAEIPVFFRVEQHPYDDYIRFIYNPPEYMLAKLAQD